MNFPISNFKKAIPELILTGIVLGIYFLCSQFVSNFLVLEKMNLYLSLSLFIGALSMTFSLIPISKNIWALTTNTMVCITAMSLFDFTEGKTDLMEGIISISQVGGAAVFSVAFFKYLSEIFNESTIRRKEILIISFFQAIILFGGIYIICN